MSDDWESYSDDLNREERELKNREAQAQADAEIAADAFAGTAKPDGSVNKKIDQGVCPTCFQSTKPKSAKPVETKKKVSSQMTADTKTSDPWSEIRCSSAADLDVLALELSKRMIKNQVSPPILNRFFRSLVERNVTDKYEEKHFKQLTDSIHQIKIKHVKKINEKKISKSNASYCRDPIKGAIDEGLDEFEDFF